MWSVTLLFLLFFSLPLFSAPSSKRNRLQNLQQEVEQAKSTLQDNIYKVVTRGEKLDDLEEKAEALQVQAFAFQKAVQKIRPDDIIAEEAMSSDDEYLGSKFSEEDQLAILPPSLDVSVFISVNGHL